MKLLPTRQHVRVRAADLDVEYTPSLPDDPALAYAHAALRAVQAAALGLAVLALAESVLRGLASR